MNYPNQDNRNTNDKQHGDKQFNGTELNDIAKQLIANKSDPVKVQALADRLTAIAA